MLVEKILEQAKLAYEHFQQNPTTNTYIIAKDQLVSAVNQLVFYRGQSLNTIAKLCVDVYRGSNRDLLVRAEDAVAMVEIAYQRAKTMLNTLAGSI